MEEELVRLELYDGSNYEFGRNTAQSLFRSGSERLSLMIGSEQLIFIGNQYELMFLEEVLRNELDLTVVL